MWRDHGVDLRGAMITCAGSAELITPTELITAEIERVWGDHGADLRGALITRTGSTELITPDMRGCGYKGI